MPLAAGPTESRRLPRASLGEYAAFLAPFALLLSLGLADGGFGLEARHTAGILVWLTVIAILGTGAATPVAIARPAMLAFGLVLVLAALSLASSLWSGSVERSFAETGRVLTYLGILLAAFLIAQTNKLRQRFAEGLVFAILVLALLALTSRLAPDLIFIGDPPEGTRLRFPLGYWNALGALIGICMPLLLWMRHRASSSFLRRLSTVAIPLLLLTLYFTYSRGGMLTLAVAVGALLALSEQRLRHLAVFALAVLATIPAVLAVQSRRELAEGEIGGAATTQGLTVLAILLAGTAAFLIVLRLARRSAGRYPEAVRRSERAARDPRLLRAIAAAITVGAIVLVVIVGGRAWDQFSDPDIQSGDAAEERLGDFSGAGRYDFWRVALESFAEDPVLGTGAGTYAFTWRQERSIDQPVQDAHSLYLEPLSELGVPGGLLVVAVILTPIGIGLSAHRRELRGGRERTAALVAAMVGFAVAAGIDWHWEIAAIAAVFFLLAGLLIGVRSDQIRSSSGAGLVRRGRQRYGLALAGIALGWASIAILVGPLLMQFEIGRSQSAAADGQIAEAAEHAETARSLQPWAASPYVQLGGLAELEGNPEIAFEHYDEAVKRETDNWQVWYLAAEAAAEAGDGETSREYLERAEQLNPLASEFDGGD